MLLTRAGDVAEMNRLYAEAFPAVELAKRVGRAGATYPAVFNAANEQAVDAFHEGRLGFVDIVDTVEKVVDQHAPESGEPDVDAVLAAETWARRAAHTLVEKKANRLDIHLSWLLAKQA